MHVQHTLAAADLRTAAGRRRPAVEVAVIGHHDRRGDVLVVCEVKTRSSESFGTPAEALTPVKLRRQWRLAARWLAEHQPPHRPPVREVRVDLVAVLLQRRGPARVEHVRGVW